MDLLLLSLFPPSLDLSLDLLNFVEVATMNLFWVYKLNLGFINTRLLYNNFKVKLVVDSFVHSTIFESFRHKNTTF